MSSSFYTRALASSFSTTCAQRRFRAGVPFHSFVQVNNKNFTAEAANLSDEIVDGEGGLCRLLQKYDLPCTDDSHQTVTGSSKILAKFRGLLYPRFLQTNDDVPEALHDRITSAFYYSSTHAMLFAGSADKAIQRSSAAAHTLDV